MKRLHVFLLIAAAARCGRHAPAAPPSAESSIAVSKPAASAPPAPSSVSIEAGGDDLWRRADEGEADDLARLADREGAAGLIERARATPAARLTALRSLAYADGHAGMPFLAEAAVGESDAEATAALESLADIAARPRRATDPEDAAELREGCDVLLALARDPARSRSRRIGAIRALRMMVDLGCAKSGDIPTDLDARK